MRPLRVVHGSRLVSKLRLPHRWPGVSHICITQAKSVSGRGHLSSPCTPEAPEIRRLTCLWPVWEKCTYTPAEYLSDTDQSSRARAGARAGPHRQAQQKPGHPHTQAGRRPGLGSTRACGPGCTCAPHHPRGSPDTPPGAGGCLGAGHRQVWRRKADSTPTSGLFRPCSAVSCLLRLALDKYLCS